MLNEFGFVRKTYADLLESMEDHAKSLFGEDVRTSANSVLGILIRVVAWALSLIYELLEKVYFSSFINSASGVSLDKLASNYGLNRSPASAAVVELTFTGEPGYVIEEGVQFATETMIVFYMIDVVTLDDVGRGKGQAVSIDYSAAANVAPNTITEFMDPVEELLTVGNPLAANGGAEAETDKELRDRIKNSLKSNPGPPVNGIISAVSGVDSVKMVKLVENNGMDIDEYGNPPKSIHIYVLGGDKQQVGVTIFESVAAGIMTIGNETVSVKDVGGFSHAVRFDYAAPVPIHVQIKLKTNVNYPLDAEEQIRMLVTNYIAGLAMGSTVRFSYLYSCVYQIPGIDVAVIMIGKNKAELKPEDIVLNPFEAPTTVDELIEVVIE